MKIIKYHLLDSTNSINSIAINQNQQYIAFGDSNKQITIFKYQNLLVYIKTRPSAEDTMTSENFTSYFLQEISLPKITLEYHTEQISTVEFAHTQSNILFSGSYDKTIAIWCINPQIFQAERYKSIKMPSEVTDFIFYPDDSYLLVGSFDSRIYIVKCNFHLNTYDIVSKVTSHDNIVNSISLDPHIEETGRFASLSDKGRLVLSSFNKIDNSVNQIQNYEDFIDPNHKCTIHQKKIDWSVDGKWIISVDHHVVRKQNILHSRLINLGSLSTSQFLIGHDSPTLVGKFSKCLYNYSGNASPFQMLSTSDKNGNLFIWRFDDMQYKVLCEISIFSESNVTNMLWAPTGEYLFTVNSTGTVSIIQFDEFDIKLLKNPSTVIAINEMNNKIESGDLIESIPHFSKNKRIIKPEILPEKRIIDFPMNDSKQLDNFPSKNNMNNMQQIHQANHEPISKTIPPCLRCERQMHQVIENQVFNIKLDMFQSHMITISYENRPYDNNCSVKLTISSQLLYANRYDNRMIKLFKANNFIYAFYDTNFTLNIFTLFNSVLTTRVYIEEVSLIEAYEKYILILTSQNRLIILDTVTRKNILDENLLIASDISNVFQTKIDKVAFLSLDKIVLYANTFNVYKNTSVKLVFLFNCTNNSLVQATNLIKCEETVNEEMAKIKLIRSVYNEYIENAMLIDKRESTLEEYYKINSLALFYEEQMRECEYFSKKNEYLNFLKKLIELIKENDTLRYKLFDVIKAKIIPEEIQREVEMIIQNAFSSESDQVFLSLIIK